MIAPAVHTHVHCSWACVQPSHRLDATTISATRMRGPKRSHNFGKVPTVPNSCREHMQTESRRHFSD